MYQWHRVTYLKKRELSPGNLYNNSLRVLSLDQIFFIFTTLYKWLLNDGEFVLFTIVIH